MEAQTDLQTYLEEGKQALARGKGREAAIAYAHAAQIEPENPLVHLGLAEANLALGSYGVVHMASRKTQELAQNGPSYELAQALLDLLDRRYPQALQRADTAIKDDPGNAYAHALRSYLLRVTGQDYDAGLARSRASRLSFGGTFENCFPQVEPLYNGSSSAHSTSAPTPNTTTEQEFASQQREQIPAWSRPNTMQRRAIRTRFWLSQNPRFFTNVLISINVLVYLILAVMSRNFLNIDINTLVDMGAQAGLLIQQGEWWRIFTAMFLHVGLFHVAMNMLSLFFIGPSVELLYGKWRYLVIYMASGIIAGLASQFTLPANVPVVGASGAIAGIFGALGAFFLVNRRALGPAANGLIGQWVFWLMLNVVFNFSATNLAWQGHLAGLIAGLVLGAVLIPPLRRRSRA